MAHNTSYPAKIADFINRSLFEWLLHPIRNYRHNQINYKNTQYNIKNESYGKFIFACRYAATLIFTIIPVIPALYILSRLAVIADIRTNPLKVILMSLVPAIFSAIIFGFGFNAVVNQVASWAPKALAFLAPVLPAPAFVVMGLFTIVAALGLYGAKCLAQMFNEPRLGGYTTSPKHNSKAIRKALRSLYDQTRLKQKTLKDNLHNNPEKFGKHGEGIIGSSKPTTSIEAAEATIELGKQTLANLEDLIKSDNTHAPIKRSYEKLFGEKNPPYAETGVYFAWKNAAKTISMDVNFDEEEILFSQREIQIHPETNRLRIM